MGTLHRYLTCLIILLAAGFRPDLAGAPSQPRTAMAAKSILVLHAHEANAPVFQQTGAGISRKLESGGIPILNQFHVTLDLRRNPGPEYRRLLVEEMRVRCGRRKIDMIVTIYLEALEFLLQEGRDVLRDIPILALYLPQDYELPQADRLIIGHFPVLDITGTLEIALKLVPGANHIYVVSGTHTLDRGVEDQAKRDLKKWESRLEFHYLSHMSFEDILTALSNTPPGTVVLHLPFTRDAAGKIFASPNVVEQMARVSAAPIFGMLKPTLGHGIIGGSLLDFERIGEDAGELVLEVLGGPQAPENIRGFRNPPSVPMFDWRQLRKWNLSGSALPKGSLVVNRESGLWDLRYYIAAGLAFILAQSFLLVRLWAQQRRRKSAEDSLRQKTVELDQFFGVSTDLLCIASVNGYFLRLNPAWERTLGYTREELMATRFLDFVHPEDLASTQNALSRLGSQQQLTSFTNRYRCRGGGHRWLEWTATPAKGLIYAAARDVTDHLTAQAEAMQRREEFAHMARVATLGELTASLAHEINQPLTAILSNAQAAQRFLTLAAPDISEVRQILGDIVRDDRRAAEVVRNLRALIRKKEPCHELLDLNQAIREVIVLTRGEALLAELSVTTELSPDLKRVRGDHGQLQQVILNLILNSAAAMRNTPKDRRKIIVRTEMQDKGTVRVSLTDFGAGIDENNLERLFEPFYTTKSDGLGMGLSISQRIIKAHGGIMQASNNPAGGATFSFSLPAPQGDPS
ncbi:MAG: ATP-binding protein [bacterium]